MTPNYSPLKQQFEDFDVENLYKFRGIVVPFEFLDQIYFPMNDLVKFITENQSTIHYLLKARLVI